MNFFQQNNLTQLEHGLNVFEYMARVTTYKDTRWTAYYGKSSTKAITDFLLTLGQHRIVVGENFLWTYCLFQFQFQAKCWAEGLENYNSGELRLENVFGLKAYERWKTRDVNFDWLIPQSNFVDKFSLSKLTFYQRYGLPSKKKPTFNALFNYRQKFNHDPLTCFKLTGGLDRRDPNCLMCPNKLVCLELLKTVN